LEIWSYARYGLEFDPSEWLQNDLTYLIVRVFAVATIAGKARGHGIFADIWNVRRKGSNFADFSLSYSQN
jgi:hypothetical protein